MPDRNMQISPENFKVFSAGPVAYTTSPTRLIRYCFWSYLL